MMSDFGTNILGATRQQCSQCKKFMKKQCVVDDPLEDEVVQWWSCKCGYEHPEHLYFKSQFTKDGGFLVTKHEKCWFCDYEGYLPTGWVTDSGEKLICPECDWKLDQILKHLGEEKASDRRRDI